MADVFDTVKSYSDEDKHFLREMCEIFPKIKQSFNDFLNVPDRISAAREKLYTIDRAGWNRIGIRHDFVQNDGEHTDDCVSLVPFVVTQKQFIENIESVMRNHEITEAITGDFTPFDNITAEEKAKLEMLAVIFLTEGHVNGQNILNDFQCFEMQEGYIGKAAKDIDRLEMVLQARVYEILFPDMKDKLEPFWDYTEKRLNTEDGKRLFEAVKRETTVHPIKKEQLEIAHLKL